jgi:alpha-tubulin suppressor-like RCC1 family protein
MKHLLTLVSLFFITFFAHSAKFYWIGGQGNWSDPTHWSNTSGGATVNALPTAADSAYIDSNSGFVVADTLTIDQNVNVLLLSVSPNNGTIRCNGKTIACTSFISNNAKCNVALTNVNFNILGDWTITNAALLNWVSSGTTIKMLNAGSSVFTGGNLVYDTLIAASSNFEIDNSNTFDLLELATSSTLRLANGSQQKVDSLLVNGSCSAKTTIITKAAGAHASIKKMGYANFYAVNVIVDSVDAITTGGFNYYLSSSLANNASGWQFIGTSFYWIGQTGNWSNGNNWSYISGGAPAGCVPSIGDSVFFDANSFTAANQTVTLDTTAYLSYLNWSGATYPSIWSLSDSVLVYGDIVLHPDLYVTRVAFSNVIQFSASSTFNPNNALINSNLFVKTDNDANLVSLAGDLNMTDSSSIFIAIGGIDFNTYNVKAGTILSSDQTSQAKKLDFDAANISLSTGIDIDNCTNFTFIAGTSNLYIGDSIIPNYFYSDGFTFNKVTLWFNKKNSIQRLTGSNTFDSLTIIKNSHIVFDSTTTQNVASYLSMVGTCKDSIYLASTNTTEAKFNKTTTSNVTVHCVNFENIGASGTTQTAYFSSSTGTHSGWTLSATSPVTTSFTITGSHCFGDTVTLNNNSTVFTGNASDLSSIWYFNDGTGHWDPAPPQDTIYDADTTFVSYVADTNQHRFLVGGDVNVVVQSTNLVNGCKSTDTVLFHVNKPGIQISSSDYDNEICKNDEVTFKATSGYSGAAFQFFLNGNALNTPSTADTVYVTDSLNNLDTVGVISFENGCPSDTMPTITTKVNPLPVFTFASSDADTSICLGEGVNFTASASDTNYSYQYLINNSPVYAGPTYASNNLANLDVVSVVAKTNKQCRDTSSMVFDVKPLPTTTLSSSVVGNVICAGDLVTFTASGAMTYEFFVNNVSQGLPTAIATWSSSSLSNSDTVSVIGYSTFGCSKAASQEFNYTVNSLPSVTLTTASPTTICSDENITFNAGGASIYKYFINSTLITGPTSVNTFAPSSINNNDTIYAIGSFSGCSDTSTRIVFTVNAAPTTSLVSSAPGNAACAQSMVNFTAAGATNYEFFVDGISQGAPSATTTFSSSTLTSGQVVSVSGESNGCYISQAITMNILPVPNVNIFSSDPDNTVCQGQSITFTGTNSSQYEIFIDSVSQGAPQASNTFVPVLPVDTSLVYISGTGANGCVAKSNTLSVIVHPIPVIVLTSSDADNTICSGDSVTFHGAGSLQYQFFINGASQGSMSSIDTFMTTNLLNGQIISIKGNSYGCTSTSNTLTYTVNAIPSINLSSSDVDNIFCENSSVTYTAGVASTYEFFIDGVSQGAPSSANTFDASVLGVGNHVIQVVGSQNACSANDAINFTVNALPVAGISSSDADNTICSGNNIDYTASGGSTYLFYINNVPQGGFNTFNTFSSSTLSNNDSISVVVKSNFGCLDSASLLAITVNAAPTLVFSSSDPDSVICVGDSVHFLANGASQYQFFINGVAQGVLSPVNDFSSLNLTDNDSVTVMGDALGCTSLSSPIVFNVNNYPNVTISNLASTQLCSGDTANLVASGANMYQFFVNGSAVGAFGASPYFTGMVNNNDAVTVLGDLNACISSSSDTIHYSVLLHPTISVLSSDADNIICIGDTVSLTASNAMTYDFDWNTYTMQTGSGTTFSTSGIQNGDSLLVSGYNGTCVSTNTVVLHFTVNEMNLSLSASPSSMICQGTPVTFTGFGADQYEFFVNGVSQGAMSSLNSLNLTGINDQDEIVFNGYSNSTMCTQKLSNFIIMDVLTTPVISSTTAYEFCEGDSVVLLSNAAYGNQWLLNGTPIVGATDSFYVAHIQGTYSLDVRHGGNGNVWSFGVNASGIFGDSSNFDNVNPIQAILGDTIKTIAAGADFTLALSQTGKVYAWGKNDFGQLGNGTYTDANVPLLIGTLNNIKSVAAAEKSAMAVNSSGEVYVWGENINGQLATGNNSVINFPFLNPAYTNIDTVVAGKNHFLLLKNDGTVWANGKNTAGQLGQGNLSTSFVPVQVNGLSNIVALGAGEEHSFAIDNTGNLYAWGANGSGQLGLGDLNNRLTPVIANLKNVTSAQGGSNYSAFLTSSHKLFTVGDNSYGQLGLGDNANRAIPTWVNIGGIRQVSTGQYTALLCRTDGSVYGFGDNGLGQLSTVAGSTVNTPSILDKIEGATFVAAARQASHVILGIENTCSANSVNVLMDSIPNVVIAVSGNQLSTISTGVHYQWYLNGLPIPGANQSTFSAIADGSYTVEVVFSTGCKAISPVVLVGITTIKELGLSAGINAYPNPTKENYNLAFSNELQGKLVSISVMDNLGRVVYAQKVYTTAEISIRVADFEPGVYHLMVSNESGAASFRFVKMD